MSTTTTEKRLDDRVRAFARGMLANGRLAAARAGTEALRHLIPDDPEFAALEVHLLRCEARGEEAAVRLDAAIAAAPEAGSLRRCRAELRLRDGDPAGAAAEAAEAIHLDRGDADAKALLGMALLELGRHEAAGSCLAEAVRATPADVPRRLALASALEGQGLRQQAIEVLADGAAHAPSEPALRTAAMMAELRRGGFAAAIDLAEAARRDGIADACVFGLLGHAHSSLGRTTEALDAYVEALKLAPEDAYVRHLVAAAGLLPGGPRAPAAYVETVFDGYADRFDAHLLTLGYRAPGLLRARLLALRPELEGGAPVGPVLDLGCGTGLVGVALSDLAMASLAGVDLSTRMLDQAARRGIYTELHRADLGAFLADDARAWALVAAADVLCYHGALEDVFAQVGRRLAPDGLFLLTLEAAPADEAPGPGWRLHRLGRYRHHPGYVARCAAAAGMQVRAIEPQQIRHEGGAPVDGLLVALGRPGGTRPHHDD